MWALLRFTSVYVMHDAKLCVPSRPVFLLCSRTSSAQPVDCVGEDGAWGAEDTGSKGIMAAPALLGPLGGCVGAQQGPNLLTPDAAPAGNSARSRCLILHRNDRPYDAAKRPFKIQAQLCLLARHMYLAPMLHEARSRMFRHWPCQYKK